MKTEAASKLRKKYIAVSNRIVLNQGGMDYLFIFFIFWHGHNSNIGAATFTQYLHD